MTTLQRRSQAALRSSLLRAPFHDRVRRRNPAAKGEPAAAHRPGRPERTAHGPGDGESGDQGDAPEPRATPHARGQRRKAHRDGPDQDQPPAEPPLAKHLPRQAQRPHAALKPAQHQVAARPGRLEGRVVLSALHSPRALRIRTNSPDAPRGVLVENARHEALVGDSLFESSLLDRLEVSLVDPNVHAPLLSKRSPGSIDVLSGLPARSHAPPLALSTDCRSLVSLCVSRFSLSPSLAFRALPDQIPNSPAIRLSPTLLALILESLGKRLTRPFRGQRRDRRQVPRGRDRPPLADELFEARRFSGQWRQRGDGTPAVQHSKSSPPLHSSQVLAQVPPKLANSDLVRLHVAHCSNGFRPRNTPPRPFSDRRPTFPESTGTAPDPGRRETARATRSPMTSRARLPAPLEGARPIGDHRSRVNIVTYRLKCSRDRVTDL